MTNQVPPSRSLLRSPVVVTLGALLLLFSLSYAADSIRRSLSDQTGETFDFKYTLAANVAMPFIVVSMALALAWLQFARHPRSLASAAIILMTGVFLAAVYMPFPSFSFPPWLRDSPIGRLRATMWNVGSYSSLYFFAALCIVIGTAALLKGSSALSKLRRTE